MTTRIKITNEGPENAKVWYYDQARVFKEHKDCLAPGQSIEIDIWDGHLPVVLPWPHELSAGVIQDGGKLYSVPPAYMGGVL